MIDRIRTHILRVFVNVVTNFSVLFYYHNKGTVNVTLILRDSVALSAITETVNS
jgi:hypothetical protein